MLGIDLDPTQYGWKSDHGEYTPLEGYKDVCPQAVMKVLSCKCTKNSSSASCGCNKLGLKCTDICQCTEICINQHELISEDIGLDESENFDLEE